MGCGNSTSRPYEDLRDSKTTRRQYQHVDEHRSSENSSKENKEESSKPVHKTSKSNTVQKGNFNSTDGKKDLINKAFTKTHRGNVINKSATEEKQYETNTSETELLPPSVPFLDRRNNRRVSTDEQIQKLEKALQQHEGKLDRSQVQRPKTRGDRPKTGQPKHRRRQSEFVPTALSSDLIIKGNMNLECPSTAKIVRIFTSSTFTDTFHERNTLMENAYPKLKKICQEEGFEFQVVDMRWGIRDEATDDHMTTELCLREVELCKKVSTGPCFVTFLSHKYGYRAFPRLILADEFDTLLGAITSQEAIKTIKKWFKRDDNSVPPTYVLQPISSYLPDFKSKDQELRTQAKNAWYSENSIMQDAFVSAARKCLDKVTAHEYEMSVTEAEIRKVLFTEDNEVGSLCFWFHRIIEDIEKQTPNYQLGRYTDLVGSDEKIKESRQLLNQLKDSLPQRIPKKNIVDYEIKWSKNGIDPVKDTEHQKYLKKLCLNFETKLATMIESSIKKRQQTDLANPLFEEIVQQTLFCQEKCRVFHGRHDTLQKMFRYIASKSNIPFVVHGPSGCGKTSVIAMAAKNCWDTFDGKAAVIIRFIGTTPDSSTIGALLTSVVKQIGKIYGQEVEELPADIKDLTEEFHKELKLATENLPLIIFLDSLDQFDPSWGARRLEWLPKCLPPFVKLIVSTLPEEKYESLPRLKAMFSSPDHFLDVPKLPDSDVSGILNKWLQIQGRQLTNLQRSKVMNAFQKCPLPLFLKLSFDQACRWTSYAPLDETILQETIRGSIDALLARMEELHGKIFVSHALALLTLSKNGLTESELEDILSCDDEVLNDVYTYWTPPIRRLPPLLLVRLKADLGQYLVDRGADGVRVFYWYHRQFIEAAQDRYCSDQSERKMRHMELASFFSGTWSLGIAKPYKDKDGKEKEADRHVTVQPLKFGTAYNLRKLTNLPYHRLEAEQIEELRKECLLNYDFVSTKLHATSLRQVLDDFWEARKVVPEDPELKTLTETLQLSQDALIFNPDELPSQILGRIINPKGLEDFLENCKNSPSYYLLPDQMILTPPGGELVHCLSGQKGDVTSLALSPDGKIAVTCAADKSMKFWDVAEGKLERSIDGIGDDPENLRFCCNGRIILVGLDLSIQGYNVESGVLAYTIDLNDVGRKLFSPCGKDNSVVGVVFEKDVKLYDAKSGILQNTIECKMLTSDQELGEYGACVGSSKYLAFSDMDQFYLFVVDITMKSFIQMIEPFPSFMTDDGESDQYTIDALAITSDNKILIVSNCYDNNINIYDIKSMTKLQQFKGTEEDFSEKFHFTSDCKHMYFANKREVVVWSMEDGKRSVILEHPVSVVDVATNNLQTVISIADDRLVRIWDTSRIDTRDNQQDCRDKKENFELRNIKKFDNPRYLLQEGKESGECYCLQVFDLATSKVIREVKMSSDCSDFKPLGDHYAILRVERKLKLLDLMNISIVRTFQGMLAPGVDTSIINYNTDVLCCTRGRRNLKVLNIDSGKATKIIETGQPQLISYIVVNKHGTVAAVGLEDGPTVIINLKNYNIIYTLTADVVGLVDGIYMDQALITDNGKYLIFSGNKIPKGTQLTTDEYILFSWDITKNKMAAEMVDVEYYIKYQNTENNDLDTGVESFVLMDDNTVLANLNDGIMRMYDIKTGLIKQRVEGHMGSATISVVPESPYILTYGAWVEDNTFRLLEKNTMKQLASYSPDYDLHEVELTKDGYHIVGFIKNRSRPVVWELKGGSDNRKPTGYSDLKDFPEIFGKEVLNVSLVLATEADKENDPDDLDQEKDEEYDDDEYDFDTEDESISQ